jgi:hypothetical protein
MDRIKHFYYYGDLKHFYYYCVLFRSGDVRLFLTKSRVYTVSSVYTNRKNASGGMVADRKHHRRLTSGGETVSFLVDMEVRTHHHRHHHHHETSVSADDSGQQ